MTPTQPPEGADVPHATLQHFVAASTDPRTYLRVPHSVDGRACATNGHWFAVLDNALDIPELECEKHKSRLQVLIGIADLFDGKFTPAREIGIKPAGFKTSVPTERATPRRCEECDGEGEFLNGSHWYDCAECAGSGERLPPRDHALDDPVEFPSTLGQREHPMFTASSKHIAVLRKINGEISSRLRLTETHGAVWVIRFPGGRGILMPLRGLPLSFYDSDLAAKVHP